MTADYVSQFPGHVDEGTPGPPVDRVYCATLVKSADGTTEVTVEIAYQAAGSDRELDLEVRADDVILGQGSRAVDAGAGRASVTAALVSPPDTGANVTLKLSLRHGADDESADYCLDDLFTE